MAELPVPRTVYHSLLFWLGMPGLLFLLWAWWKSNAMRVEMNLEPEWLWSSQGKIGWHEVGDPSGDWVFTVDYREGRLAVRPQEESGIVCGFGISRGFVSQRPVMFAERYWFPPPRWGAVQLDASSSYRLISFPYWLSTGSYLGLWLGGLMRWQRRKARLLRTSRVPLSPP
ncbi:MAG: hypothetical protein EOP84_10660 [Verrucomicrobiaceae bacterium]|nr:MAG: hypothetical protein EOP84_10660 [Verrucomicrobiaceae bacterium]